MVLITSVGKAFIVAFVITSFVGVVASMLFRGGTVVDRLYSAFGSMAVLGYDFPSTGPNWLVAVLSLFGFFAMGIFLVIFFGSFFAGTRQKSKWNQERFRDV